MSKTIIYQLFPRYFTNRCNRNVFDGDLKTNSCGKFNEIDDKVINYLKSLGITHLWLTGVLEHATKTDYSEYGIAKDHSAIVKGRAGSPYAIKDYYDVDPDLAVNVCDRINEFTGLIDRCHEAGLKVIIDFVPNHLARQYKSDSAPFNIRDFGADDIVSDEFNPNNSFYYLSEERFAAEIDLIGEEDDPYYEFPAKVTGNDCFTAIPSENDWYETVKLNYGVDYQGGHMKYFNPPPATWFKMLDVLSYWLSKGVDGFRCDMAEMVPVEFWEWAVPRVKKANADCLFIGEVYNPSNYKEFIYKAGFNYLYDKSFMYDTSRAVIEGHKSASEITGCWQKVNDIMPHMLYFLENHDEQRIASDMFAEDSNKGIPGFILISCLNSNPLMIYNGQEVGEKGMYNEGFSGKDGRSTIFDYWGTESLIRLNNDGKWDGGNLLPDEKLTLKKYFKILEISGLVNNSNNQMFDLMYANYDNCGFDHDKLFAFIRGQHKEFFIFVINFASEDKYAEINIPKHAFDCLSINDGVNYKVKDLLENENVSNAFALYCDDSIINISSFEKLKLNIPAYSARVLNCTETGC